MVDAMKHIGVGVGWDVITFVALARMVDSTQHMGLGWGGVGCDNLRCPCTHG